jgi:hypothetical protein
MTSSQDPADTTARSPFAGCAILIAALLVMVFLIGFSTVTLFRQYNEIAKFTGEKPAPVEITNLDDKEADLNKLAVKLEEFRLGLDGGGESILTLTPEEINLAIACYDAFKELRGTFRVTGTTEDALEIDISFPLNGKPRLARDGEPGWIASDPRYLNARLDARPGLLKREIVLQLDAIDVPGATVPREFIEQMSPYRITERYLTDPVIGPAMAKLTRVSVADGALVLARTPGESPADVISDEEVDSASRRLFVFFAIGASVFLLFTGLVLFIGLRAKAKRA